LPARSKLTLPTDSNKVQAAKKAAWNAVRERDGAELFTIGYSGHDAGSFTNALVAGGVESLIDIRFTPVSMYKPDFSKRNLERRLNESGIEYLHLPALGVPTAVRKSAAEAGSRDVIWEWYDSNIVNRYATRNLRWFFDAANHPIALMCVEHDPTACHRHRLARALEKFGLQSYDL